MKFGLYLEFAIHLTYSLGHFTVTLYLILLDVRFCCTLLTFIACSLIIEINVSYICMNWHDLILNKKIV